MLRAPERKEKQRRWHAPARLDRVRSVVTIEVTLLVRTKAGVHTATPAQESGQLRFPGLLRLYKTLFQRHRADTQFCHTALQPGAFQLHPGILD